MLSFPPIQIQRSDSTFEFLLPCPDVEWIRLLAAFDDTNQQVEQRLRDNPALLIFCAAGFYEEHQRSVESLADVRGWCQHHLFERLRGELSAWPNDGQLVAAEGLKRFLRARAPSELRKSLANFLTLAADCHRKLAKRWIRTIFADEFLLYEFEFLSRRQRKQRRNLVLDAWGRPPDGTLNVKTLYLQRQLLLDSQREFKSQLLQQKMSAMKQLAYGASHEINNPLANIATRAQTLLADEKNPERRHKLAVIYEQAMRAHDMISDLMLFANPPSIECVNVDVRLWLATIIKEVGPLLERIETKGFKIESRKIEIEVRLGPDVRQLNMDPTHMSVALKMLLRNSIEAIRSADCTGKIELRVFHDRDNLISFSVIDNGVGVSEAARMHLFDPFYSSREAGRGLGFGLSKAWRIAELHRGALRFDAEYSPGTRFLLQIPRSAIGSSFGKKVDAGSTSADAQTHRPERIEISA